MKSLLHALLVVTCLNLVPPLQAVEKEEVNQAKERGLAALKRKQQGDGSWGPEAGMTALAAITLLECGVPSTDDSIKRAIPIIREAATTANRTYQIALDIIFLDLLGDPNDVPLIEALTVRLLAGQTMSGAWDYICVDSISPEEVTRLKAQVGGRTLLVAKRRKPEGGDGSKPEEQLLARRGIKDLTPETQQQLKMVSRMVPREGRGKGGDNSNTQFATIGLWVSRKHGLPVEKALIAVDAHYRLTQNLDGGWSYSVGHQHGTQGSTATMTCAGLLGLSVGHAVAATDEAVKKTRPRAILDPAKDLVLKRALATLGATIGQPMKKALRGRGGPLGPVQGQVTGHGYYFLWSLERVAVALGADRIGGKDWYEWGVEVLLDNQQADGTWQGAHGVIGADTCFALLFLHRANLAKDLSFALRGKVQDPGQALLRARNLDGQPGKEQPPALQPWDSKPAQAPDTAVVKERTTPSGPPGKKTLLVPAETNSAPTTGTKSQRLAQELIRCPADQQERMIQQLRDDQSPDCSTALADAIPKLENEARRKARHALAERLARMKTTTLAAYLKYDVVELRRAAALACAMKDSKEMIPDVLGLLNDPDIQVSRAAVVALQELTGQNLGTDRQAWLDWWKKQRK